MRDIDLPKLLDKFKSGKISDEELALLERWYLQWKPDQLGISNTEIESFKDEIWEKVSPSKVKKLYPNNLWRKLAVASIALIFFSTGSYFIWKNYNSHPEVAAQVNSPNIIKPGQLQATLTLANGEKIVLSNGLKGRVGSEGDVSIEVTPDQSISYHQNRVVGKTTTYNTLTTAKGEQSPYPLILSDGTKVWLNAASSLKFPTNFSGNERIVSLKGEGYFEVAKNAYKPFKVVIDGKGDVQVLGTHFNVNAYDDEDGLTTTLLEGRVKSSFAKQSIYLSPNQQSVFEKNDNTLKLIKNVDVDKAIAWKTGLFNFNDDDIKSVMRQLSRWYNLEIRYEGVITSQHFTGSVRRQVPLLEVLQMLKKAGGVEFKVIEKNVMVTTK